MNILQLAHRLPWPPVDGGKKGTLGFVDGYRQHTEVSHHGFLCMCPMEELDLAREWKPEGVETAIDALNVKNTVAKVIANTLFSSQPFNMEKYQRKNFSTLIEKMIRRVKPDVVHFDSLHTAWYADLVKQRAPQALRVLRCHNAEHIILQRLADAQVDPIRRIVFGIQARRLKRYEAAALELFDLILAITDADAARFLNMNPGIEKRLVVVPAGVNLPTSLPPALPQEGHFRIIHIATMDWLPNQLGLRWFLSKVLPRLDAMGIDYHLDIVGKNMPEEFYKWRGSRISVHGFVSDLAPIMGRAQLAVVPIQVGGGMRVKILDYWSMGIPVVSTRVGAEGLTDATEQVVSLADDADCFAQAILKLSGSPHVREAMRAAAFRKLCMNYGWSSLVDNLMVRYKALLRTKGHNV